MAKSFNDLIASLPLERRQRIEQRAKELIGASCGCVLCDIGLPAIKMKRQYIHRVGPGGWHTVICTQGLRPMNDGSKSRS